MALLFCQLLAVSFAFFYFLKKEKDHFDALKLKELMVYWRVFHLQLPVAITREIFLSRRGRLVNFRHSLPSLTRARLIRETVIFIKGILLRIFIRSVMKRSMWAVLLVLLKQVFLNEILFLIICIIPIRVLFVSMYHKATTIRLNICYLVWWIIGIIKIYFHHLSFFSSREENGISLLSFLWWTLARFGCCWGIRGNCFEGGCSMEIGFSFLWIFILRSFEDGFHWMWQAWKSR